MFHVEHSPDSFGAFYFIKLSQYYHIVFIKEVYYIDNETRGEHLKTQRQPKGQEEKKMKKYALCTAHAEISTQRIRHKVEDGKLSIFEGVYADRYTGDANKTLAIFDTFDGGYKALIECHSTADLCYTGCGKLLDCCITWLEEREYDENGKYELTGNVWRAIEKEV